MSADPSSLIGVFWRAGFLAKQLTGGGGEGMVVGAVGFETTGTLKTKRLAYAGGTLRSALEATGTIIGRELDADLEEA